MVFETWLQTDLKKPVSVQKLSGNLFSADNEGNLIGVEVFDNGEAATLSGNVNGYVIRPDGETVLVDGTLSGNKASIVLPSSAYAVVGQESIVIKVGGVTVGACVAYVYKSTTDVIVDPSHVVPSLSELLAKIADCEAATEDANEAASLANEKATLADQKATLADTAATSATSAASSATSAASTANAAAGKIDNMTVAASGLSAGTSPTVTISEVSGHKHIAFGIPKGDPGKDFHIAKTFSSIAQMMAYTGTDIEAYDFAMIDTGSVQDPDTGKLYCYEPETQDRWRYIGDLSGAQGIKGETGTGIDHVTLNADYTLTIYLDDNTSYTTTSIRGATGITPSISVGTVTTLQPNQQAYVQLDQSSTAEQPVFNFGIPKGDTGTVDNVYGNTIPMSSSDSTKISEAIATKLNANQGSTNAGKFMRVGNAGAVSYDNPTERYASVSNFPATGDEGKLYIAEDTGMIYIWDSSDYSSVGGSEIPDFTGATSSTAGAHGLVPAPAVADRTKFLKGDGSWETVPYPPNMAGATASTAGLAGLVPAPAAGDQDKVLYGDGTWQTPGGGTLRVVPFSIGVASWTLANGVYSCTVSSAYVTSTSVEFIEYDSSYRTAVRGDVNATKATGGGGVVFTTDVLPVATLSGEIRVFDSDDGKVAIVTQMTALPTMREVPFTITASQWALNADNLYEAVFTTAYVTATSHDFVEFDESIENATDGIKVSKAESSGSVVGMKFLSRRIPAGSISGTITPLDNADGKIAVALESTVMPIANGGTGANTLAGAKSNLGITAVENDITTRTTYSTSEVEVGKWIDGRTIYRKVIPLTTRKEISSTSWTEIAQADFLHSIYSLIIYASGLDVKSDTTSNSFPLQTANDAGTYVKFLVSRDAAAFNCNHIIMDYIKN